MKSTIVDRIEVLKEYLLYLMQQFSSLELRGVPGISTIPELPLEKVYVALRCDNTNQFEWNESNRLLKRELNQLYGTKNLSVEEHQEAVSQYLVDKPYAKAIEERNLPTMYEKNEQVLTLGDSFRKDRLLVVS